MGELVHAMTAVQFPSMRWQVMGALGSLADRGYQQRAWIDGQLPEPTQLDSLDLVVNVLFDDTDVLPEPAVCVGAVLLEGDEIAALRLLGSEFGALIDRIGDAADADYLSDAAWPEVVRLAGLALAAMVRRGGLCL